MWMDSLENELSPSEYGGKASHLSTMLQNGFPVPLGWAISKRVFEKRKDQSLLLQVKAELARLIVSRAPVAYMVRSSAIGEDSEGHSFAGQLSSFISGQDIETIWKDVLRCWESYDQHNVASYSEQSAFGLGGMGVVIQELIDPDWAGVGFSRSHVKEESVLIEYVKGHGEQLVSGEVDPLRFHFDTRHQIADGDFRSEFQVVVDSVMQLEQFYGYPVDVEWVIKDGRYFIVQSRPITTLMKERSIYWSNTNVNENYPDPLTPLLYSVARNSYYHYFKNLSVLFQVSQRNIQRLERSFTNVIGAFGGRMYYNMSSIHEILSASPFAELLIKSFDHFVGYDDGKKSEIFPSTWKQKIKFLFNFLKFNRALPAAVTTFERRAIEFDASVEKAVVLQHHQDNFHAFIEIRMHSWYHASLADFFAMSFHGFLGKFAVRHYGELGVGIQNQLIQAIPHLISSEPVMAIHSIIGKVREDPVLLEKLRGEEPMVFWHLVQKEKEWEPIYLMLTEYLNNWGYRCSGELMLTHDNYIENPSSFVALIKQMEGISDFNPAQKMREKYAEAQSVKAAFRKKIMRQFWYRPDRIVVHLFLLHYLVKQSCNGISSRERVRLKQAQLYFGFKKSLHAIGENWVRQGFIDERDDVLFFTYLEIAEHLESSSLLGDDTREEIKKRKQRWKDKSNEPYPDDFYTYFGRYYQSHEVVPKNHDISAKGDLIGLCACGGRVEGTVRVLESVLEAEKLRPGDILVTRQTDPGWVTVFPLISGLIVERGGMLSHGAIVSREFGIPAIVGVHEATRKLKDGDRIILNASQGLITLKDE